LTAWQTYAVAWHGWMADVALLGVFAIVAVGLLVVAGIWFAAASAGFRA
jgi:hypothetical protein